MYGWSGRFLRVNLSDLRVKVEKLDSEFAQRYIGGNGFAARVLWDELSPGVDPFSPDNKMVIAAGPLSGTTWPSAGRLHVAAKSPLSEAWGEGNCGGYFAPELKYAGYDMIIVEGASEKPVYLWIHDEDIEIKKADKLWGLKVSQADMALRKEHGKGISTALIGPAGENLARIASIQVDRWHAVARSGLGGVMGSKKLKGIVVHGTGGVKLYNRGIFYEFSMRAKERLLKNRFSKDLMTYGTPLLVNIMHEIGRFPTKNCQLGSFVDLKTGKSYADLISGERLRREYHVRDQSCFACPFACKKYHIVEKGRWKCDGGLGLEYETLHALGSLVWNKDLESIIYGNRLCNEYGFDTDGMGGVIAHVMELWERGIITKEDTGGLKLEWGNPELIIKLIEMTARREGFGDLLAEGTYRVALKFGPEAMKYAMVVKKVDIPAQDGRAQKSMGLSHVTANRGADHLTSAEFLSEVGFPDAIIERFEKRAQKLYGRSIMPEGADRLSPVFKPLMVYDSENMAAISDSLVVCKFTTHWPPVIYFRDAAKALTYATGIKYTEKDLRIIGERIFILERCFNVREGLTKDDDRLPERFLKEPAPAGGAKGHIVELDKMLPEYYRLRGYDERGLPTYQKLKELGLEDVAKELKI